MADKYTTIQGDTFESVAWKTCGRSGAMWELIRANRRYMDVAVFESGVELTIPDLPQDAEESTEDMPPWRR